MKSCQEKAPVIDKVVRLLGFNISSSNSKVHFVSGQDIFVALPTHYGMTIIYACFPRVFDLLFNKKGSIDVSVPHYKHTDVFSTLISAILARVKTFFHRFMRGRNPHIDFVHPRITAIHFAQIGLWHVTRPFPSLAVGWVWLVRLDKDRKH